MSQLDEQKVNTLKFHIVNQKIAEFKKKTNQTTTPACAFPKRKFMPAERYFKVLSLQTHKPC